MPAISVIDQIYKYSLNNHKIKTIHLHMQNTRLLLYDTPNQLDTKEKDIHTNIQLSYTKPMQNVCVCVCVCNSYSLPNKTARARDCDTGLYYIHSLY